MFSSVLILLKMAGRRRTRENSEFEAPREYIENWIKNDEANDNNKENLSPAALPVKRKAQWRRTREESENSEFEGRGAFIDNWLKRNAAGSSSARSAPTPVKRRALDFSRQNKLREIELWFEQEASKVQQHNFASRQVVQTWSRKELRNQQAVGMPVNQQYHQCAYNELAKFALQELQNFAFRQNEAATRGQPVDVLQTWNSRETLKENVVAGPVKRKLQWNESWHNAPNDRPIEPEGLLLRAQLLRKRRIRVQGNNIFVLNS